MSLARATGLLAFQIKLASYLPFTIYHVNLGLCNKVKDSISNMSRADYFYAITYPTYIGFKVVHEPTFTAYATLTPDTSTGVGRLFIIIIAVVVAVIAVAVVLLKRKPNQNINP